MKGLFHCSVFRVQDRASQTQIRAQRSGFDLKRKHNEMSELSPEVEAKDMEFVLTRCAFSSVGRATDS